jgi:acetylglutamate kinase
MDKLIEKAGVLIEALPYIQRLANKTVVIKYGGAAMLSEELSSKIMQDVTLLKFVGVNPILVHGGGNEINGMLEKLDIKPDFHNGLRITDDDTMDVVQMVLTGRINKDIVAKFGVAGAKAIGLCGKDANLITAEKKMADDGTDLGHVGQITSINTNLLDLLVKDEYIPVIAPIGVGKDGESYNINADTVAGEIAAALSAQKLMFLTDIDGIRSDPDDPESLISIITIDEIYDYIESGVISGGMLPKVDGCIKAIENGVKRTHILNGTIPHPILLEIFTDKGIGTMVRKTIEE